MVDDPLALDNQVCFSLYAANRAVTALYRPLLDALGLTYPQYLVMLSLWEADRDGQSVRVSTLGKRLRLDSGTLTPLLKRLEKHGLVVRARSETDERVVTVLLSESGRALRERAQSVPGELMCRSGLDLEDADRLRSMLQSLLHQLDESSEGDTQR